VIAEPQDSDLLARETSLRSIQPVIDRKTAEKQLRRRGVIGSLFGREAEGRLELLWMPFYWFSFEARGGEGALVHCVVESYSGEVSLFNPPGTLGGVLGNSFAAKLDAETAEKIAREHLNLFFAFSLRGKSSRELGRVLSREVLCFPFWVQYFERRRGKWDIRVLDAARGTRPGSKLKASILAAILTAAKCGSGPGSGAAAGAS
jgi:hypothetical protein